MDCKYNFKTKPYKHQQTALDIAGSKRSFGFFMEMGTGKSKVLIDNMGMLYQAGEINFALIIAPKGVYRNWVSKELPQHMPDDVPNRVVRWVSSASKKQQKEMAEVKNPFDGLTIFVMNVEAFSTLKGKQVGQWFGRTFGRQGMIAIDESTTIKNNKAKRSKNLCEISAMFKYKRLLTGSPITKSPLDIYQQAEFLGKGILGHDSFYTFQMRYAVIMKQKMGMKVFNQVMGYKNIEELTNKIDSFSYRVLKKDCLDLPEKVYTVRHVEMTEDQTQMYENIRKYALQMFEDDYGEAAIVSTPAVITQLLRMQQVLSGHLKDDDDVMHTFKTKRIDALKDILHEHDGKAIIWSRFRHDIKMITDTLNNEFGEGCAASYFGDTSDDDRNNIVKEFQDGQKLRYFVGNPATAGYGLTLTEANLVVYYANDFNLETRMQSEDRAHRIGQKNRVTYVDLITENTIDEKIVKSLQAKIELGAKVLGEEARQWLSISAK